MKIVIEADEASDTLGRVGTVYNIYNVETHCYETNREIVRKALDAAIDVLKRGA